MRHLTDSRRQQPSAEQVVQVRRPQITIRGIMVLVAFVAAVLAVRNEFARMHRRQIQAEIDQLVRALQEYRSPGGAGWNCRGPLPDE